MQKFKSIVYLCVVSLFIWNCSQGGSHQDEAYQLIEKYKKLLLKEPSNCFYLGQMASSYQALYDLDNAIVFYQKAVELCPNNSIDTFQLGVCYYLKKDEQKGIAFMDRAIEISGKSGNNKLTESLLQEKKSWQEHRLQINEINR